MKMKTIFPASYLSCQLSMTGLMIVLSLGGNPRLAADVGIVQGAALALFLAFSGNVRNLIFKPGKVAPVRSLVMARLLLMLPVGAGVYYLGAVLGSVAWDITLILILRKSVEWLVEIHLSEAERDQDAAFAWRHLFIQSGLLFAVAVWAITGAPGLLAALMAWAIVPLFISLRYLQRLFSGARATGISAKMLFPHLGSSAVMGIGVYVFRLIILFLVGRATAGNLYAAFAIGGALGSIFASALGPSLVLHEQKTGQRRMPGWLRAGLILSAVTGIVVIAFTHFVPDLRSFAGGGALFWYAIGFSLIGGAVMVLAQRQRLRDLQYGTEEDVFAPDVLVNILIVAFLPFIFFVFGAYGLTWLYLFNAMVALVFYWMADVRRAATGMVAYFYGNKLRAVLAVLLVVPVFVNLETGLFQSASFLYDSGGVLSKLPIPLSAFCCYAGIALLGNYRRANLGLAMIFGSFVLMLLSTVATSYSSHSEEQAKLILLMQYILPMFAIVLGMTYEDRRQNAHIVEKSMLMVIAALIPAQLLASWAQAQMFLTPYLYLFSIYQHLQYVPVIVVSGYLIALFSLWNYWTWRILILALAPLAGIYVAASGSMLAGGFILAGCAAFAVHRMGIENGRKRRITEWAIFSLVLGAGTAYHILASRVLKFVGVEGLEGAGAVGLYTQKFLGSEMLNVQSRLSSWQYYLRGIFSDPMTFLFGHSAPPDRSIWASAHNYYLDFIYNFGSIAALVIIGLIVFTVVRIYQYRKPIMFSPTMTGLAIVVLFLLFPDNLLKVSMRQPYPGIITFFLWGLLLARIESLRTAGKRRQSKVDKRRPISVDTL
jgi:hypothetical protein